MSRQMRHAMVMAGAILLAAGTGHAGIFDSWQSKMAIHFDGYTRAEALTNFPALVVLGTNISEFDYADFLSAANADLRFTDDSETTELNYEIEGWDTNGNSCVWVQVPLLTNGTTVWAYWGRGGVSEPAYTTNGATWSNGYVAVWHMDEADARDSTASGFHGFGSGVVVTQGVSGSGLYFDGSTSFVQLTNVFGVASGPFTFEAWGCTTSTATDRRVLDSQTGRFLARWNQGAIGKTTYYDLTADKPSGGCGANLNNGTWQQTVYAMNQPGNVGRVYQAGAQVGSSTFSCTTLGGSTCIGSYHTAPHTYVFQGVLDELRFSTVLRSSNWVWAGYMNLASNGVFATNGAVERVGAPLVQTSAPTNVTGTSAFLNGTLVSTGLYDTAVHVYWGETDGGTNPGAWLGSAVWTAPQSPGTFTTNVPLDPGKEYYYRYAASNAAALLWATTTEYFLTADVTVSVDPAMIGEDNATGTFAVVRPSTVTGAAVTVNFSIGGTASNDMDYTITAVSNVTIMAGATSAVVQATSWQDLLTEGDETVILTLGPGSYATGALNTATLTITNIVGGTWTNVWWVGGAGVDTWSAGANWTNGLPPSNDGKAAVRFDQRDNGRVTRLDPGHLPTPTNVWHVGNLMVANSLASGTVDFTHVHDLQGNRLVVSGNVSLAEAGVFGGSWARAHFTNGTLQIGVPDNPKNLTIGSGSATTLRYGELKVCPGAVFDPHISTLTIGVNNSGAGILDLRGATVANGILDVQDLRFCTGGQGNTPYRAQYILIDADTGLTEFRIRRYFDLAYSQMYTCRIGDPDDNYRLPPEVSFTVGSPGSRGRFYMASAPYMAGASARLEATSGGWFHAYVTEWLVHPGYFGSGKPVTYFDIRGMTNVMVDCLGEFSIGRGTGTMGYDARVRLCPGSIACSNLTLGVALVSGSLALLELNGTTCQVSNSVTIGPYGTNVVNVGGTNCGPSFLDGTMVSITSPGRIQINFLTTQAVDQAGTYWGLRWQGDHQADLAALRSDGTLSWTSAVPGYTAGIYYDAGSNETYVALRDESEWEPLAICRNLDLQLVPPDYTNVVISAADVDAGSFDPGGAPITNRWVQSDADLTPAQPYVTFDSAGAYTVWLTVVNSNGLAGSNSCTITVGNVSSGTTANLTWDGQAILEYMPRSQWMWSMNWVGDVPPTNPTPATITFADLGLGPNSLYADRTIGPLTIRNETGEHGFDLAGRTLTVEGNITVNPDGGGATARAVFSNGTLRIGTAGVKRSVTIGSGSSFYYTGQMVVAPGTVLDAHLAVLTIGNGWGGRGYLDLRGAAISNRLFQATDIILGPSGQGTTWDRPCEIRIDESTEIDELRADRYLDVCAGEHNTSRIGNPSNSWRFSTNLSLTVGSPGQRGRLRVGCGYWSANGALSSASGGVFTATLTDIQLGQASASGYRSDAPVDFKSMTSCAVDVSDTVHVGYGASASDGKAYTLLALPPGTVAAKRLIVGLPQGTNRLELHGTVFTVTNQVTVGQSGTVSNFLYGSSGGLDLDAAAALSVSNGGVISIAYVQPRPNGGTGPYWGLKWAGDHVTALQALKTAGKLVWNRGPIGMDPQIFYTKGVTYVGYPLNGSVFVVK